MDLSKLEKLRKIKKLSYEELAQMIGMSKNGLNLAVKNDTLKISSLEKIAQILGVKPSYFFEDQESPVSITMEHNGNGHNIAGKNISLSECIKEIEHLKEVVKLKDEIIEVLRNGRGNN